MKRRCKIQERERMAEVRSILRFRKVAQVSAYARADRVARLVNAMFASGGRDSS